MKRKQISVTKQANTSVWQAKPIARLKKVLQAIAYSLPTIIAINGVTSINAKLSHNTELLLELAHSVERIEDNMDKLEARYIDIVRNNEAVQQMIKQVREDIEKWNTNKYLNVQLEWFDAENNTLHRFNSNITFDENGNAFIRVPATPNGGRSTGDGAGRRG